MAFAPGLVRDAVDHVLRDAHPEALALNAIYERVRERLGSAVPLSSVRSSVNLRPAVIEHIGRGRYRLARP